MLANTKMRSINCTLGMVSKYDEPVLHRQSWMALIHIPDKPDETLESDSKYPKGHNPVIGEESKANN